MELATDVKASVERRAGASRVPFRRIWQGSPAIFYARPTSTLYLLNLACCRLVIWAGSARTAHSQSATIFLARRMVLTARGGSLLKDFSSMRETHA